jgi:DNA-binding transcriptional MerR regulator
VSALLTIGEFSRVTHLSAKALRLYDELGLLRPGHVDPTSGYRRYSTAQVPTAHVIRRFRDLQMPLEQIGVVLTASDLSERDQAILEHLHRMEQTLEQTQATVASLRALLEGTSSKLPVEYRSIAPIRAVAIPDHVEWDDAEAWLEAAADDLHRILDSAPNARAGTDSALYSSEFFESHAGEVTAYVPVAADITIDGRAQLIEIPAVLVAVAVHRGPFSDLDETYGALGTLVAERMLGAEGPIREHYLVSAADTADPTALATEVCWPIHHIPKEAGS